MLVGVVGVELRVEGDPDFRAFLADGRDQDLPGVTRHLGGFLDPAIIQALIGADLVDVVLDPGKDELSAVFAEDAVALDLVIAVEAEFMDLLNEKLVDRFIDRVL